jgi:serine/threonine-protein kinase
MAEPSTRFDPPMPGMPTLRVDVHTETPAATNRDEVEDLDVPLYPGMKPLPDYELVSLLGRGGYGEVWKAHGPGGFDVALKFIRFGNAVPVEERALDLMRSIKHPHLLPIFGAWRKDKFLIIAMELGAGTLMQRLQECKNLGQEGIPFSELREYLAEAARAIDYLNERGIQHRDVKPQNLLMVGGGVKVADFGLAKFLEQSMASNSGALTPAYAAPEFFNGQISQQSDQYSLAITYCQLRGGRLPFTGNPAQLMAGHLMQSPDLTMLPSVERPVLSRALAKKPEERWPTCRAFAEELQRACNPASRTLPTPIPTPVQPPYGQPALPAVPMDTVRVKCPQCGKVLRVKPEKWHKRLRCPTCQFAFQAKDAQMLSGGLPGHPPMPTPTPFQPPAITPVLSTPPIPPLSVPRPMPAPLDLPPVDFPPIDGAFQSNPPPLPAPPPLPGPETPVGQAWDSYSAELTSVPAPAPVARSPRTTLTARRTTRGWSMWVWLLLLGLTAGALGLGFVAWWGLEQQKAEKGRGTTSGP